MNKFSYSLLQHWCVSCYCVTDESDFSDDDDYFDSDFESTVTLVCIAVVLYVVDNCT